jgi:protein-S-isoprenylcysteine O-methyltransferase Ste14
MIAAVAGACLLAETRFAWITGAAWLAPVMVSISMEEREMRSRFGAAYEDYCRRVPRFLPLRARARRA